MDEFEALLGAPSAPLPTRPVVDEFTALTGKPSGRANREVLADLSATTKNALVPETYWKGVERRAFEVARSIPDLADIVVGGLPAMAAGTFQEAGGRLSALFDGRGYAEGARAGSAAAAATGEAIGRPFHDAMVGFGWINPKDNSIVHGAMGKVSSWLEDKAAEAERATGGRLMKEDYLALVNAGFTAMGVKGTKAVMSAALARSGAKGEAAAWEKARANDKAQVEAAAATVGEFEALSQPTRMQATPPEQMRAREKAEAAERKKRRAEVRAAFAEDPDYGTQQQRLAEGVAEAREAARAEQTRLQPAEMAERTRPPERVITDEQPRELRRNAFGDLIPETPSSLDSAIAKIQRGRAFDLTSEERIALRGSRQITDPRIVLPAAVGAAGLGLMMAYPDSDAGALAAGAGALMLGRGREPLTLETIHSLPDATPLGAILDRSPVTLKTLEMLPRNRFEFPVGMIEELLKRQEVTKAERDVLTQALETRPPGSKTITAKELMQGFKVAAGDFELRAKRVQDYATYGLENIDRTPELAPDEYFAGQTEGVDMTQHVAPPARTTIYQTPEHIRLGDNNHFGDPRYFGHTRSFEEGGVRHVVELQSDLAQKAQKALTPDEKVKLEDDLKNVEAQKKIFQDEDASVDVRHPDYVAGVHALLDNLEKLNPDVRLVVGNKLASDRLFANPESPKPDPEVTLDRVLRQAADPKTHPGSRLELNRALASYLERLDVLSAEHRAKLKETAATSKVEPMLKNWHKRLIREELADAAREPNNIRAQVELERKWILDHSQWPRDNEVYIYHKNKLRDLVENLESKEAARVVRFADADTVAKVEGWPSYPQGRMTTAEQAYLRGETDVAPPPGPRTFSAAHQGIYDRYSGDVTKFLKQLGGKHVIDEKGHGWWEVPVEGSKATPAGPRVQQFGGIDPKLAEAAALIGGGAALVSYLSPPEKRGRNAGLTAAVLGLGLYARSRSPAVADWAKSAGRGAEYTLGLVSTELGNLSRPILHRLREFERKSLTSTHESLAAVAPFIESVRALPKDLREKLNLAILSNDSGRVIRTLGEAGQTRLLDEWKKARGLLDRVGDELKATGRLKGLLPDYYPRVVIDPKGLLEALGKEQRSALQTKLDSARAKSMRMDGRDLSPLETSQLINEFLRSRAPTSGRPGFLKRRTVDEVTPELAPFYAPASESLPLYLRAATKEIERARFFGDDLVRDPEGGLANIDLSIGNVVNRERLAGKLDDAGAERLRSILASRFGPGERAMAGPLQTVKNLTNAGLLGHVTSAFVQSGDLLLSVAAHGMLPTIKALQQTVTRNPARVTVRDLGLVNHISEEIIGGTKKPIIVGGRELSSAKFVEKVLKYAGFSLVDQLGKNVSINASLAKNQRLARSPTGVGTLRAKYGEAFGPEFEQLVADLRSGKTTEPVRALLFSELSDIQPITKLEVPQAYLDNPNGRIVYMLKTFMLKQADIVRREAIGEMRRGNVREGTAKLLRYGLALGIGGAGTDFIRNWLLGRTQDLDWKDIPENVLKTFGWSQYVVDKARQGKVGEAVGSTVLPPWKMWEDIITGDPKAVNYLPLIGRILYAHQLGGAEKANAAAEKRREKEESK